MVIGDLAAGAALLGGLGVFVGPMARGLGLRPRIIEYVTYGAVLVCAVGIVGLFVNAIYG